MVADSERNRQMLYFMDKTLAILAHNLHHHLTRVVAHYSAGSASTALTEVYKVTEVSRHSHPEPLQEIPTL